ncbi:MAG TPA: hypothetical protein DDX72_10035 [Ruminococcaceae bacterium]|nr:hypothetical protein [Oscillospiraceae bacterium]
MKKTVSVLIVLAVLLCAGSCSGSSKNEQSTFPPADTTAETESTMTYAPETTGTEVPVTEKYIAEKPSGTIVLTNKMTELERSCARKRPFSLLDEQLPEPEVKIGNVIVTKEASVSLYQELLDNGSMTEEEFNEIKDEAADYSYRGALIDGVAYTGYIPEDGYDGGYLYIDEGFSFDSKEEFFDSRRKNCEEDGMDKAGTECFVKQTELVFDAVINATYTTIPDRYERFDMPFNNSDPFADFRSSWEYDAEALSEIKDQIDEYLVYDEQLGLEFLVHVTMPPDYNAAQSYPVFFMTDGVWRLNDHAALYKAMEQGEAADVILVSLAYDYYINGTEDPFRDNLLIKEREKLLDFICDDLMPYLGENYNIDYADSTLFGHSMGGVFSHCACFKSDLYENQPFFRYIVGSPAFFNLYGLDSDYDADSAMSEYGYFDRNEVLKKKIFICGGSLEDPDYSGAYHGHDSLLKGLEKLNERISAQKADLTYKLFESHHYQYVPGMLLEFLKAEYPHP